MILYILIILLMKLQCDAIGNTTFSGKLRFIAAQGSNVVLPCTFSRNQSDVVTLILFYRNASHVGTLGAPLYTLDARMMNDYKSTDVGVPNSKRSDQPLSKSTNEYIHNLMRQSNDRDALYLINNANQANRLIFRSLAENMINYEQRLFKRSPANSLIVRNKNLTRYSNGERITTSVGNVSMVNGISSLMHLLAIKGHLNQSRTGSGKKINRQKINLVDSFNQTELNSIDKKNSELASYLHADSDLRTTHNKPDYRPIFYQLKHQNDENWPRRAESNLLDQRNQVNNSFESKYRSDSENVDARSVDQSENQPLHFVAPHLANRIKLSWPPSQLKQHQPYNSLSESSNSNATTTSKKLEFRSQTNHIANDPLLHFKALLNIKNATEEDSGEYLCRVDLRYGRTIIQHIVLEIVSPPDKVIILDSNSQVLHDWTNAYLENANTIFHCEVDGGRPQTPIEWLLNGELLNPTWSNSIKLQNSAVSRSQLHLRMTRELFNSSLSCRIQSQFFAMSATVRIDLILKPQRITLRPTISPLIVDNQVDLIVQTHGSYPPSELVCFLNNQTLSGEIKKANHLKLLSTTTLIVKFIPIRSDHNEEIVCKAINHAFPVNESIELRYKLDVNYKPILKLRLQKDNPNRLIEASSLALKCEIDSNPPFKEIQWFKNDLPFAALNNQIQSELRVDNTSLVTNSLSKQDSGRYACSARNSVGTSDSEYITIDVLHAPECRRNQKLFYGIEYGETSVIDCSLLANPSDRLTFHWRFHSNGDSIDLATISTQIDDFHKRSNVSSTLVRGSESIDQNSESDGEPIASRYQSDSNRIDKNENFQLSNAFTNKPSLPSSTNERSNLLQQIFISSNGSSSSLHYTMKHNRKEVGSYIECWASNSIGVGETCMYSLVVLDVPDPVENCSISAPINNFHLLECSPGKDGGLPPQIFHLEVFTEVHQDKRRDEIAANEQPNKPGNANQLDRLDNQMHLNEFRLPSRALKPFVKFKSDHELPVDSEHVNQKINFNQPDEYEDYLNYKSNEQTPRPNQLVLIANYTEYSYPTFVLSLVNMNLSKLNPSILSNINTLHLYIYSSNAKGRSAKISLDFNIGNQTSQLKNLFAKTRTNEIKFDLLNEWTLIFTATFSTMMIWLLCLVCYMLISNKIKQIKITRRYINNCNKNAVKANQQNSLIPVNHQGLVPFVGNNINEITDRQPQFNVIKPVDRHHDSSVYGSSSMIINHFEQKNFDSSSNCLSSAELLKLKIKQFA